MSNLEKFPEQNTPQSKNLEKQNLAKINIKNSSEYARMEKARIYGLSLINKVENVIFHVSVVLSLLGGFAIQKGFEKIEPKLLDSSFDRFKDFGTFCFSFPGYILMIPGIYIALSRVYVKILEVRVKQKIKALAVIEEAEAERIKSLPNEEKKSGDVILLKKPNNNISPSNPLPPDWAA